jgi:hypothetical protein
MNDNSSIYSNIPEEYKRDLAFNILVSIRDAVSFAQKNGVPPTYEDSLRICHDINEDMYEFLVSQLTKKNESDLTKLYKDKAAAESLQKNKEISVIELLNEDITKNQKLLDTPSLDKSKTKYLRNHIISLKAAKENCSPRTLSEHRILERDFCKIDRNNLGAEKIFENDTYVDYKLNEDRYLRLRILHPDKSEHILGADLIYEQFNVETQKVRIAVLQYKTWDKGVLYSSSSKNLENQIQKMRKHLCDKSLCQKPVSLEGQIDYRFPYCCAFLRPTDKIQKSDSKLISHGIHIPLCSAIQILKDNDNKIDKKQIRHSTLTHEVFGNLFNHGFIGSRWLPISDLENFYREIKVINQDQHIKVYAKEIIGTDVNESAFN